MSVLQETGNRKATRNRKDALRHPRQNVRVQQWLYSRLHRDDADRVQDLIKEDNRKG